MHITKNNWSCSGKNAEVTFVRLLVLPDQNVPAKLELKNNNLTGIRVPVPRPIVLFKTFLVNQA